MIKVELTRKFIDGLVDSLQDRVISYMDSLAVYERALGCQDMFETQLREMIEGYISLARAIVDDENPDYYYRGEAD